MRIELWFASGLMAVAAAVPSPAQAQAVQWGQALEAAWQRSPEWAASQGRLRRAEAALAAAGSVWPSSPALELSHRAGRRNPVAGRATESEAGVSWPLWLPGQRVAQLDAAQAEWRAARSAQQAARIRMSARALQAGLTVTAHDAEVRLAQTHADLAKALAQDVERRVRAGDLARADAMAARAEELQAQVSLEEARGRARAARVEWQLLTGLPDVPQGSPPTVAAAAAADHPELEAARENVERARRQLSAVERAWSDPPEVGVHTRRESDASGSANSVGVSLRIPLGTTARNAPALAQAHADLDAATQELDRAVDRIAIERESARQQEMAARAQLQAEQARASLLRERAGLIDRSFRAGESALADLLRARTMAAQADAAVIRQQAAVALAQARTAQALGVLP